MKGATDLAVGTGHGVEAVVQSTGKEDYKFGDFSRGAMNSLSSMMPGAEEVVTVTVVPQEEGEPRHNTAFSVVDDSTILDQIMRAPAEAQPPPRIARAESPTEMDLDQIMRAPAEAQPPPRIARAESPTEMDLAKLERLWAIDDNPDAASCEMYASTMAACSAEQVCAWFANRRTQAPAVRQTHMPVSGHHDAI